MLRETVAYLQAQGECQGPPAAVPSAPALPPPPQLGLPAPLGKLLGRAERGSTCTSTCTDPHWNPKTESGSGSLHVSPDLTRPHCSPALSTEGIFRRSANTQIVREVQQKYNMGEWLGCALAHRACMWMGVGLGTCV